MSDAEIIDYTPDREFIDKRTLHPRKCLKEKLNAKYDNINFFKKFLSINKKQKKHTKCIFNDTR